MPRGKRLITGYAIVRPQLTEDVSCIDYLLACRRDKSLTIEDARLQVIKKQIAYEVSDYTCSRG